MRVNTDRILLLVTTLDCIAGLLSGHAVSTIGFDLAVGLLVFPSIKRTSPQSDWMMLLKK